MGSESELSAIHLLRLQLKQLQDQLDRGPILIKARQQIVASKEAEIEAHKTKTRQLKMELDQKNLQLKTNEAKIDTLRGKLNAAGSNREFDILRGQIEADTMANSVLEDEILAMLEKVDQAKVQHAKLEQELAQARADEKKVAAEIAAAEQGNREQRDAVEKKVLEAEKIIPGEIKLQYSRLVQSYGPDALTPVEDSICSHCYVQQPQQTMMELRNGKFVFCKTCGRLMYANRRRSGLS